VPIGEGLRATLGFLEKLTLHPGDVGPDDLAPLRAAGVSDQAIEDAIQVCALFNLIDRVADALAFEVPPPESVAQGADRLLKHGYQ
jgi:alkylhydroperoxidase family enzyme